jgi:chromosome segregation ATPase
VKLFKSEAEKLEARLTDLETAAKAAEGSAVAAQAEALEAQGSLVDALAEGLPVVDWQAKRDEAEARTTRSQRDAAAHQEAIAAVTKRLEAVRTADRRKRLLEDLATAKKASEKALRDLKAAVPAFADALARAKRSEQAAESAVRGLLGEGVPTRNQDPEGFELPAGPSAETVVEEAVRAALPVAPEGGYSSVALSLTIPTLP